MLTKAKEAPLEVIALSGVLAQVVFKWWIDIVVLDDFGFWDTDNFMIIAVFHNSAATGYPSTSSLVDHVWALDWKKFFNVFHFIDL